MKQSPFNKTLILKLRVLEKKCYVTYLFECKVKHDGGEPLRIEKFGNDCLWPLRPKNENQGMHSTLDSWNLDDLTLIALFMTYDDDDCICDKECVGIMS